MKFTQDLLGSIYQQIYILSQLISWLLLVAVVVVGILEVVVVPEV
jgi:hypothetical protein